MHLRNALSAVHVKEPLQQFMDLTRHFALRCSAHAFLHVSLRDAFPGVRDGRERKWIQMGNEVEK
jgi:hypothetical protein